MPHKEVAPVKANIKVGRGKSQIGSLKVRYTIARSGQVERMYYILKGKDRHQLGKGVAHAKVGNILE